MLHFDATSRLNANFGGTFWILFSIIFLGQLGIGSQSIWLGLLLGSISVAMSILVWQLIYRAQLLFGVASSPAVFMFTRIVMGFVAGLTLALGINLFTLIEDINVVTFALLAAFSTAWLLTLSQGLLDERARIVVAKAELIADARDLETANIAQQEVVREIRATLVHAIELELAPVRVEIENQLKRLSDSQVLELNPDQLKRLTQLPQSTIRPIISLLNRTYTPKRVRARFFKTLTGIIRTQPIAFSQIVFIYVISRILEVWLTGDWALGIVGTLIGISLIYVITRVTNTQMKRHPNSHSKIFLAGIGVLLLPTWTYLIIINQAEGPELVFNLVFTSVVFSSVVLLASGTGYWRDRQVEAQREVRQYLDADTAKIMSNATLNALVARDAARKLHGPLQARLVACSVAMQSAAQMHDLEAFTVALRNSQAILERPINLAPEFESVPLADSLGELAQLWRGIVDILWSVSSKLEQLSAIDHSRILQIVEEGVTNSVRHGGATRIEIEIEFAIDLGIDIRVSDDGSGVSDFVAGIGTSVISELTGGVFSLQSQPGGGAVLTAQLVRFTADPRKVNESHLG